LKPRLAAFAWLAVACSILAVSVAGNPPGGLSWHSFFTEPASFLTKLTYLAGTYLRPAFLSFTAIILFQLQFRLTMSGASAAVVFAIGVTGSTSMLAGFRSLSAAPNSLPGYVFGMALAYTVMARLYAVRLRTVWGRIPVPWIVWRGNPGAVQQIDRRMARDSTEPRPASCEPGPGSL
jgi:hypothetical protein